MILPALIERIDRGRHACFSDNEEPRDVLISRSLKPQIEGEGDPYMAYMQGVQWTKIMGLHVEWVNCAPEELSIRTVKGDLRRLP